MERKKLQIVLILFLCFTIQLKAGYRSDIYTAYVSNNMKNWKSIIDKMQAMPDKTTEFTLELVNYQYGYIGWCIGMKKYGDAKKYLDLAERNISLLSGEGSVQSIINSYKAAFYGFRIGMNSMLAPFLGLKSIEAARLAMESDPDNPLAHIQHGNIKFYTPPVFGGSKAEAITYYLEAMEIMEKNKYSLKEDWNYLNLLVIIAQSYSYLNDIQSTRHYIDKILNLEPDISWVREELYPQLMERVTK